MSEIILHGVAVDIHSDAGQQFIANVARVWEGLVDLELVQARYGLTAQAWTDLATNTPLVQAVKEEMERRIYNDTAAKERAQLACKGAPALLEDILTNTSAPPRSRIEASKELRAYAHNGKDDPATGKVFNIVINLSADGNEYIETFSKPFRPITDASDDKRSDDE